MYTPEISQPTPLKIGLKETHSSSSPILFQGRAVKFRGPETHITANAPENLMVGVLY